jgi:hypothetical protein
MHTVCMNVFVQNTILRTPIPLFFNLELSKGTAPVFRDCPLICYHLNAATTVEPRDRVSVLLDSTSIAYEVEPISIMLM